jgi:hypothetical protein
MQPVDIEWTEEHLQQEHGKYHTTNCQEIQKGEVEEHDQWHM